MTYNAKTNWKPNDPVTEDDFNRIEQGIKDAHNVAESGGAGLVEHEAKRNNPHHVNKTQVGLGNVDNVKQATKQEFDSHATDDDIHVTKNDKDKWNAHESNKNNPHNTTKGQVGLSNVENYGIATEGEAKIGISDTKYMTPQKTKVAIDAQVRPDVDELVAKLESINIRLGWTEPIFGVEWDKSSNPEMGRIGASKGMTANIGVGNEIVKNDFDDAPIFGEMKIVNHYWSGDFVRIPKFYIRKQDRNGYKSMEVSRGERPGFYLPRVFWDFANERELDYFDYGAYLGSLNYFTELTSGKGKYPDVNMSIVDFREAIRLDKKNEGHQLLDIHAIDVLRTLMFVEFGTLDMQSVMQGFVNGNYSESDVLTADANGSYVYVSEATADKFRVGQSISVGTKRGGNERFYGRQITSITKNGSESKINFSGMSLQTYTGDFVYNTAWKTGFSENIAASSGCIVANDGNYPCMYRGIESPYGDIFEWVDGININDHQAWVADDVRDYASNLFAHPYRKLGYTNATENGYAKEMGFDVNAPFAEFPTEIGASGSTYYSDYYHQSPGQRVARFGGYWHSGAAAGPSAWNLYISAAATGVDTGARLLRKPL